MAFKITEQTWLDRAKTRVGGVLKAQMKHNDSYTAPQLIDLIEKAFPLDTYTEAELGTIRNALIADGVIEVV